jgi:Tol biopolymer transport system component
MDNGQTAELTNVENGPSQLVWSPDGKLISFSMLVPSEPAKIANLPKAPEGAKWADPPKAYDRLVYRFNGRGYLKSGFMQRFVVSADGGAPRQLTSGNFPFGGFQSSFGGGRAAWTPDGKYLIFSANLHPDYEYDPLNTEIYELSLADGTVKPLTSRKGPDNSPTVSPDGKTIAYVGFDDRYQGHQTTHLYLMNRDGSNPRVATPQLDRDVEEPHWAPDGSGIYFMYDDQGDTKLAFYSMDGKVKDLAAHVGSGGSSYSGGASFTVANNGIFTVSYGTPSDAGDIAVGSIADSKTRVLTAMNQQLFMQKAGCGGGILVRVVGRQAKGRRVDRQASGL